MIHLEGLFKSHTKHLIQNIKSSPVTQMLRGSGNLPLMWDKSLRNMSPPDNEKKKAQKSGTTVTLQTQAVHDLFCSGAPYFHLGACETPV